MELITRREPPRELEQTPAGEANEELLEVVRRGPAGAVRAPRSAAVAVSMWSLFSLSALAIWLMLYAFVFSGYQEQSAQHSLYAGLRTEIAQGIAPLGGRIKLGTAVAFLQIPQAGVSAVVVEGTTSGLLEQGPGLEADTPLPGQVGVSVIFGRQAMFGGPFRHLDALQAGDKFRVTTGAGVFTYKVIDLRYPGDPFPPPVSAGGSRITFVTVVSTSFRNAEFNDEYLYVDADLVGKAVPDLPGLPAAVPANQLPMTGNQSVYFVLVLWLQLLLIVLLVLAWVGAQWSVWQTWLVGAPVIIAVLWAISETVFQLLPNLL
jgi:sortase A